MMVESGKCDMNEALTTAAGGGSLEMVKLLVEKGAGNFDSGMKEAMKNKQEEIADFLWKLRGEKED